MSLYQKLAEVLDYPGPDLSQRLDDCIALSSPLDEGAASLLKEFRAFLEKFPLDTIKELYTRTFDLEAVCYPYVGYHLFGDGNHRGMFLAGLIEHYQIYDFSSGNELPDCLSVMLRFLARDVSRLSERWSRGSAMTGILIENCSTPFCSCLEKAMRP